jgi:hypothetical protein
MHEKQSWSVTNSLFHRSWAFKLGLTEVMTERRQIDHEQLLQLSRTILLLAERQELLLDLPAAKEEGNEVLPIEGFSRAS